MHGKFNCITVDFDRTQHGIYRLFSKWNKGVQETYGIVLGSRGTKNCSKTCVPRLKRCFQYKPKIKEIENPVKVFAKMQKKSNNDKQEQLKRVP